MDQEALRRRLKTKLDRLVDEALASANPPGTIEEIETLAVELGERARQEIAQELADASTEEVETARQERGETQKVRCGCGRFARYKGERRFEMVTMAGVIGVSRAYFYCRRCDAGFCPADRCLGWCGSSYTRRVQQELARLDALLPYTQAVGLLEELTGVCVSAKHAQRLVSQAEEVLCCYLASRKEAAFAQGVMPAAVAASVMYVEADGVQTPMVEGWREMKVGLVRCLRADGIQQGPTLYVSHLGDSETFGQAWYAQAAQAGVEQAGLVVALGDGSAWIWNQVETHFPHALQILDFWHAAERLWEIGREAYGWEVRSPRLG